MTSFRCEEESLRTEDEYSEDVVDLKRQISKLALENEKYRQELYEVQRKLETNATMQSELVELNEALEQSLKDHEAVMSRRIHEVEEKQIAQRKLLQEKLEETETELAKKSKENQDLRETIKVNNEKLLALSQDEPLVSAEDNSAILKCEIERLEELLAQEAENNKHLEDTVENVQSESNELREILAATKGQLAEKDRVLESTKDELSYYRMELESLKTTPVTETCKGNSLFAEVEDRRKMTLEQMTAMRNSYLEAKRSFQAKEAEIKALKAERAMLLRKWEDDTVEKVQQDASLCNKYKERIAELERQLKEEQKKQKQTVKSQEAPTNNFSFLQSLVDAKKKEIEELLTKIENDSIKALLEEETKHKLGKQLRHWRHRAMSGEAQLLSIKNRLESDPSSSNAEILATIESCLKTKHNELPPEDNSMSIEASYRETTIANQTVVTLENLMTIPKVFSSNTMDSTSMNSQDMDETACVVGLSNSSDVSYIKKEILSPPPIDESVNTVKIISSVKLEPQQSNDNIFKAPADKSNDENEQPNKNSDSNVSVAPILKSVLANSNTQLNLSMKTSIKETNEKDRKTLRFTEDTIDPPSKPLKKQTSNKPKYPIIFISCNKSKVENDVTQPQKS